MKKKNFKFFTLAGILAFSLCATAIAEPSISPVEDRPISQPEKCFEKMSPPEMLSPEERRAEFDRRLNLTTEQKTKLESIKAEEHKKLAPIKTKIQKKHEEMKQLIKSELEIKKESMKKFETILTDEQKAELDKMKKEMYEHTRFPGNHPKKAPCKCNAATGPNFRPCDCTDSKCARPEPPMDKELRPEPLSRKPAQ